jgi:hypothetical protein
METPSQPESPLPELELGRDQAMLFIYSIGWTTFCEYNKSNVKASYGEAALL